MHKYTKRIALLRFFCISMLLSGCDGGIGSDCVRASDCAQGYCYIPAQSDTGTCKKNETKSIP